MARPLRVEFGGAVYHLTARGSARRDVFLDDEDRSAFLDLPAQEVGRQGWLCCACCPMSNHCPLLIEAPEPNPSRGMRRLNGVPTRIFNRRHRRVGHLLQGRHKSILVDREACLIELCRYVALSPVRANLVDDPAQRPWSSHAANAGLAPSPGWPAADVVLGRFGQTEADGRAACRQFVMDSIGRPSPRGELAVGFGLARKISSCAVGPSRHSHAESG